MNLNATVPFCLATGIILVCILLSCSNQLDKKSKYREVLTHFKNDPLRYNAAKFLINNLDDKHSNILNYRDIQGKDIKDSLRRYTGNNPESYLDSSGYFKELKTIPDVDQIKPQYLVDEINRAFENYHHNPLRLKTTFNIFCNFVLPYRVGTEEINNWRSYFNKRYTRYLRSFGDTVFNERSLFSVLSHEQSLWYNNVKQPGLSSFMQAQNQTYKSIIDIKYANDCEDYSVFYLYLYRSLGIPAAYELVPLWGKFNYGHTQVATLYKNGRFYPVDADTSVFKYKIAKMYRRFFEKQENPYATIRMTGESEDNIPQYFNFDHFTDITGERTITSNVQLPASGNSSKNIAYLCVYNAGEWKPVEWSSLDKKNNTYLFRNMGRKILYQLATYRKGIPQLINHPFILDTLGHTRYLNSKGSLKSIKLSRFDRNNTVNPGKNYILKFWDGKHLIWKELGEKKATDNTINFINIPDQSLLKLEEESYNGPPVRPFTINNATQIWW